MFYKLGCIHCLALLVLGYSVASLAEQKHFSKREDGDTIHFSYKWTDKDNQNQAIDFSLSKADIAQIPATQEIYKPALARRYVTVELLTEARKINPKQARIQVKPNNSGIAVEIRSQDHTLIPKLQQQFEQVQQDAFKNYLDERYYMEYETSLRQRAVKPDHIRYVGISTHALIPLSQGFYEQVKQQSDAREYLNLLLGWLQTIPYNTLEDRLTSNGSGFAPPISVLQQNQADCDSKSVVAASLIRAFLPSTPMVMIFLRNHALLGIAIGARDQDDTIVYENVPYVLLDPTGPALLGLGEVHPDIRVELSSGHYSVESIPRSDSE